MLCGEQAHASRDVGPSPINKAERIKGRAGSNHVVAFEPAAAAATLNGSTARSLRYQSRVNPSAAALPLSHAQQIW